MRRRSRILRRANRSPPTVSSRRRHEQADRRRRSGDRRDQSAADGSSDRASQAAHLVYRCLHRLLPGVLLLREAHLRLPDRAARRRAQERTELGRTARRRRFQAVAAMNKPTEEDEAAIDATKAPLMGHLIELRKRLIWSIAAFIVCFLVCFYFAKPIYAFLTEPLAAALKSEPSSGEPLAADGFKPSPP